MALGKLGVLAWLAKAVGRLCCRPRSGLTPEVTVVPESAGSRTGCSQLLRWTRQDRRSRWCFTYNRQIRWRYGRRGVSSRKCCGRLCRGAGWLGVTRRARCVIPGLRGCLLCFVTAGAGVVAEADADACLEDALARALGANERWEQLAGELRAENAWLRAENERLRERDAQREAELERVNAALAVLQRMVFGRSSEGTRPDAAGRDDDRGRDARDRGDGGKGGRPRGPGARAGRRDYSHLPRVEAVA